MALGDQIFEFGRFRLDVGRRSLCVGDAPIAITGRAFDILHLLVENADRIVTKDEIMDRVWQGMIVEESNLAVQISGLRRALSEHDPGAQFIATISGRGYRFVGERRDRPETPEPPPAIGAAPHAPSSRRRSRRAAGIVVVVILAAAAVAAFFGRGLWPWGEDHRSAPAPRLSIVVLPFRNLGDDIDDAYLADAVSDDLTTDLSHLPGSVVIARASADIYKGGSVAADRIGRDLGVRYLLEGSLRRSGESLSINAQLIDAASGAHLWAERFEAPRRELSNTQATIVSHIGAALDFTLVQIEAQRSLHERPNDPDSLDLFFRARSMLDRDDTLKGLTNAQALLEQAIELQPDFADAIVELAWVLLRKVSNFDDPTDADDMANARKLVARALERAPRNARALAARGFLLKLDGRCQEAEASDELALTFDGNDLDAHTGLALCAANLGHPDEAERRLQEILTIDPQDPKNRVRYNQLGLVDLMLGRNQVAAGWFQKAMVGDTNPLAPDEGLSRAEWNEIGLIAAYAGMGRLQEARARYAAYLRLWPHRTTWRLASYFTKAESGLPGLKAAIGGLKAAGMPEFADESAADSPPPSPVPKAAGDFEPAPSAIPGAKVVATSDVSRLLLQTPAPIVVDVGCGAAVIPGAVWLYQTFPSAEAEAQLERRVGDLAGADLNRTLIVMGTSKYGWNAYNAALALAARGYHHILWYRGGEEAWAASGMMSDDRRDP